MYYFPRADIHELLSPDILHQLIKGTFKDHLVAWVEDYIKITAESERKAKEILDDIDRRYVPPLAYPGRLSVPTLIHPLRSKDWQLYLHSPAFAAFLKGGTSSSGQVMIPRP